MPENKKPEKDETSKKIEVPVKNKKATALSKASSGTASLAPATTSDVWEAFNDTFERFRSDFEDLLFPENWQKAFSIIPETRVPVVDLENREKDFLLKAEMPGFKKADIEIEVGDDLVAITGNAGWTYDKKGKLYVCKERACKTFYREVELPEEIKVDEVTANLSEGLLEITLPKKTPKQRKKVALK
jgi:HSP20 family protein